MSSLRLPVFNGSYQISTELLTRGLAPGRGPERCNTACCRHGGAYVDLRERDRILAHAEWIIPQLDDSQNPDPALWFEREEKVDADYPSGKCAGTAAVDGGACTFLDRRGRCSLQVTAVAHGLHKWALKPTYCALFPLEVSDGVVKLDSRARGDCCTFSTDFVVSALQSCREELVHLVGAAQVAAFEAELLAGTAVPAVQGEREL